MKRTGEEVGVTGASGAWSYSSSTGGRRPGSSTTRIRISKWMREPCRGAGRHLIYSSNILVAT